MLDLTGLYMRAALLRFIRTFFFDNGFLEVDTPLRHPVIIPENTIVPVGSDGHFLQTSPELCMKRLLAAGCDKIFQICPCFRKGEIGNLHLEEFTLLEWYRTDADYVDLMGDCESLLRSILLQAKELYTSTGNGCDGSRFTGLGIDDGWNRLSVEEAFERYSPVPLVEALATDRFDEVLVEFVEPQLGFGVPTILYNYPAKLASLAKLNEDNPLVAERFELYINGVDVANGFSELTDEVVQEQRFQDEINRINGINRTNKKSPGLVKMPHRFLTDLKKVDKAAGIALGVDRLFMLLLDLENVSDGVSFGPADL